MRPWRSALANVEYPLAVRGMARDERRERARRALDSVGLAALAGRPARVLSGGEQQRLALARAWAARPSVLFLDEPTASLDPSAAAEVERVMGEIEERLRSGLNAMNPETIFKTWLPASMQGVEQMQQLQQAFWSQLANIATGKKE